MAQNKDHNALDFGRVAGCLGSAAAGLGMLVRSIGSMLNIL
jgi:hypothetical protein